MSNAQVSAPANADVRTRARRGAIAAWVGSALEFYDFFLYSTASALILAPLFFPKFNPLVGTLVAFTANATAFLVRPIGGLIFGYLGDRVGRRLTLMLTLALMGIASAAVGCVPSYETIGVAAPILLVICRLLQGIAQGGEHTGGVLIAFENAPEQRRGFYCSWSQSGVAAGFVISAGVFALTSYLSGPHFIVWAWRIPFIASLLLVALGMWVRRSVFETLDAEVVNKSTAPRHSPISQVLLSSRKELVLAIGLRLIEQAASYIFLVFGLYYLSTYMHVPRNTTLTIAIVALTVDLLLMPVFGWLSDIWGRRQIYLTGAVLMTLWIFPAFRLLQTHNLWLIMLAFVIGHGVLHAMLVGVQVTIIADMFPKEYRYTGTAMAHEIGTLIAGAATPIVATAIVGYVGGDWGVSLYVMLLGVISIICTVVTPIAYRPARLVV